MQNKTTKKHCIERNLLYIYIYLMYLESVPFLSPVSCADT